MRKIKFFPTKILKFCLKIQFLHKNPVPIKTNSTLSLPLSPTYITPKNFDFVKPAKEKEVALDASRLEGIKKQTTENQYDGSKLYWDNTQKLPQPPPTPTTDGNENAEEENNLSDHNNKELDKQIDLPMSPDTSRKDDDKKAVYAECKFDEKPKRDE